MAARLDDQSTYSREQFDDVIARMRNGQSVRKACMDLGIERGTFYGWISGYRTMDTLGQEGVDQLRDIYTRTRGLVADAVVDDVTDAKEQLNAEGIDSNTIQRHRARADIGIRLAPLLAPRVYGVKAIELSGPDGGAIQIVASETERKL